MPPRRNFGLDLLRAGAALINAPGLGESIIVAIDSHASAAHIARPTAVIDSRRANGSGLIQAAATSTAKYTRATHSEERTIGSPS